jgi:tripartite-type tricarboxylate transporter receptor subunit TctC
MKKEILFCGFLLLLVPTFSLAQEYPTRPMNVLVSVAAGGSRDTLTRVFLGKAEKLLGQPFIITNNGGGGGTVGPGIVAKEKPDGYHLLGGSSSNFIVTPLFRTVPYKLDDFIHIAGFVQQQTGLVVRGDSPWKTLKEFVQYAKNNPGKVTYSTLGVGTTVHLAMEVVAKKEGIQWTHVPFTGGTPALTALLGGHVTATSGSVEWVPHVKSGEVRLLATHSEKRMKMFPDTPTFRELGYNFITESVSMISAPKGTPPSVIKKLEDAFRKPIDDPEFNQAVLNMNLEVTYRNSTDLRKFLVEGYALYDGLIRELKLPKEEEK